MTFWETVLAVLTAFFIWKVVFGGIVLACKGIQKLVEEN